MKGRTRARRKLPPVRFTLRFYPGRDDDLLEWFDRFDDRSATAKNQAVKDALRRAIGADPASVEAGVDLGAIRRVVEAAVNSALARFEGQITPTAGAAAVDEDAEVEALLDELGAALILDDDE